MPDPAPDRLYPLEAVLLPLLFDPDARPARRWTLRPRPSYLPHPRRRLPRLRGVVSP